MSNSDLITNKRPVKTVIGWNATQNESFELLAQNHDKAVETYNNFMAFNLSWFRSQIESFSFLKNHGVWFIAKYYDRLNFWIFSELFQRLTRHFLPGITMPGISHGQSLDTLLRCRPSICSGLGESGCTADQTVSSETNTNEVESVHFLN